MVYFSALKPYSEGEDVIYKHYAIVIAGKEFHVEGFVSGTVVLNPGNQTRVWYFE